MVQSKDRSLFFFTVSLQSMFLFIFLQKYLKDMGLWTKKKGTLQELIQRENKSQLDFGTISAGLCLFLFDGGGFLCM